MPSRPNVAGSGKPVKAQDSISLAQNTLPPQRSKSFAGVEMLVMLRNDQALGFEKPGLGEKTEHLVVIAHLAVGRIEKAEIADHGLRIQHAQCGCDLALDHFKAFFDPERR